MFATKTIFIYTDFPPDSNLKYVKNIWKFKKQKTLIKHLRNSMWIVCTRILGAKNQKKYSRHKIFKKDKKDG